CLAHRPPCPPPSPSTPLFRSWLLDGHSRPVRPAARESGWWRPVVRADRPTGEVEVLITTPTGIMELYYGRVEGRKLEIATDAVRSEEHTSELQSREKLVCRLL